MIQRMTGVSVPGADKLLEKVAEAITSVDVSNPNAGHWMDRSRNSTPIKTGTQSEVVQTLAALGVSTASSDWVTALLASGHPPGMEQINAALSKANVSTADRLRLKLSLERFNRLPK
jgi:hypothetical protein